LAGTEAFNRKQYAEAAKHWNALVAVGPAGNPLVEQARAALQDANELGQLKPASESKTKLLANGAGLGGRVELAPGLVSKIAPTDEVMVFARAAAGSRMPLAMLRTTAKSFPLSFKLDDTMAMAPQANLSSASGELVVVVRIGKKLQAVPQPGDIEAVSDPVKAGAPDVVVTVR
jgi:cytochrome c-type biogenesis protein CcmH